MSGHGVGILRPEGSQGRTLQQEGAPNYALLVNIAPGVALVVDVSDRAGRLLGIVYGDQGPLTQRAASLDLYAQLRSAGVEIDPRTIRALTKATDEVYGVLRTDAGAVYDARDRAWNLGALDVPDLSSRWARQLGLVDLSRVLGAALTSANPVIMGVFDAAGNRMPAMDALTRPGFVRITDGTYVLELDPVEPVMPAIEFEHHMVHEGHSFTVDDYDADVDTGATKYWHIRTPDSAARIHIKITLISDLPGLAEFYENPTTTNDGVALTAFNNDRNSGVASTASFYRDPVVTGDGTRLAVDHLGTNNPKTRFGGATREQAEWILKQNEQYLIKFTTEQDNAHVAVQMEFYEVPA